tara:strand:- start:27 stop:128 length:102 start_codon:yes stop_codon:yes gene_type:complete
MNRNINKEILKKKREIDRAKALRENLFKRKGRN